MTREEIIQGLQFTIDMFLFDPSTGETFAEPRNDMDKTTIEACKGAIKELRDNSYELWKESYEVERERSIRLEEKIKALDQEPILNKISAEIDHVTEIHSDGEFYIKNIDVKRIIGKYKAESEDKE